MPALLGGKMENLQFKIRPLKSNDDLEEITKLIRTAYKVLADKGFRYWGTFQSVQDTKKRFSDGYGFVAEIDNKIVGTITLKENNEGKTETPWYDREEVCHFTQFAVRPEFQKSGLGSEMMEFIENFAKEKGFNEISLDTCEDAKSLIEYYNKRGYRFVEHVQWDLNVVNYRSVVLSKPLN